MMKSMTAAALVLLAALAAPASAADYPTKPLRIIVGYLQGGGNDIIARLVGAKLHEFLGQPVIVENKPGADTIIATEFVAKSAPDGYTLLVNAMGGFAVTPALHAKLPYDPLKDFVALGTVARFPHVLAVSAAVPAATVNELVAHARTQPGRLNYGSSSTAIRLATEVFAQKMGITLTHVPYKGSSASAQALLTNEVQMVIADAPPLLAHVKSGKIKLLAVTSAERMEALPSLPTFAETPALAGFDISPWIGLFAPAGTPAPVVATLNAQILRLVALPEIRERLRGLGAEAVGDTPQQAAARVRSDMSRYADAARAVNLAPGQEKAK
jgi:tripartite-type tricarboxylate transporter receptor subunit TctC